MLYHYKNLDRSRVRPWPSEQRPHSGRGALLRHRRALLIGAVWLLLVAGVQLYAWRSGLMLSEVLDKLVQACRGHQLGPLLFLLLAALSPLLLLPAALFGSVAGLAFGPLLGVLYTLIGCNLSASLMYLLGRLSAGSPSATAPAGLLQRYGARLRQHSFRTIVLLRLSFLPYDPVNYCVGVAQVGWLRFIAANTVGSLPGVLAIVLAGAALGKGSSGMPISPATLLLCAGLLVLLSFGVATALARRRG